MKKYIIVALACALLIGAIFTTKFSSPSAAQLIDKPKRVMGVSLDYPPFEFVQDGEVSGFDIDLARMLAEEMGFELEIKDLEFNSLIAALNSGQVDFVISSMTATEERQQNVDFTRSYYNSQARLVMKKDRSAEEVIGFHNTKIGVQFGSVMELFIKKKQEEVENLRILSVARVPQLVAELKLNRIDGIVTDSDIGITIARKNPDLVAHPLSTFVGGHAIALPKNSKLTEKFNKALDVLEEQGKLDELREKWIKDQ